MLHEIYKSEYVSYSFDSESEIFTVVYFPESEWMEDEEWESYVLQLEKDCDLYKPKYLLSDNRNRYYSYAPEMQAWTLKTLLPTWIKNGLEKYVQVLSEEFIAQLSSTQIIEMANKQTESIFKNNYFSDYNSAFNWLKE